MHFTFFTYHTIKPIFHQKLGSCWLSNANAIDTKNMKCIWPMLEFGVGDPMRSHWGLALGGRQILAFALGVLAFFLAFLDTNILV